jgi:uncharacterized protein (DUF4213/DUF364 family)
MNISHQILDTLADAPVLDVRIGLHWTAVVVEDDGSSPRCGLAATLLERRNEHHHPVVPEAGYLLRSTAHQLAGLVFDENPTLRSIGMAAINALLPQFPHLWVDANAEIMLAQLGAGKRVALVGHFPFVERLRPQVGELQVLELNPQPGDLPASQAAQVIPHADVVAITGMTLVNHTLEGLLQLCPAEAFVMLLGPSTPLSPILFEHGVDLISGAVVEDIPAALNAISQGGNFRQVHRAGVRLVNIRRI